MIDYAFIAVFLLLSSTHTWLLYPQNRNPQVETSLHMLQQGLTLDMDIVRVFRILNRHGNTQKVNP